jgi:hypothetical protein
MLNLSSSRLCLVAFTLSGMLLSGCQKNESNSANKEPARQGSSTPAAPTAEAKAPAKDAPGGLTMKLDDPQTALDFLEQSGLNLKDAKDDCALLAEDHATLGGLVRKARETAATKSVKCEAAAGGKTWSCKADFTGGNSAEPEASEFALSLQFNVDDATRAIQPDSLVCLMAG